MMPLPLSEDGQGKEFFYITVHILCVYFFNLYICLHHIVNLVLDVVVKSIFCYWDVFVGEQCNIQL